MTVNKTEKKVVLPEEKVEVSSPAEPSLEQVQQVNSMLMGELAKLREDLFDKQVECSVLNARVGELGNELLQVSKKATKLNLQLQSFQQQSN